MRLILAVAYVLIGAVGQSTPKLCWDHDGLSLSRFETVVDSGTPVSVGKPTPEGTTYCTAVPTLAKGSHTIVVRACYDNGTPENTADDLCASSTPITVVKL